MTFAFLDNLKSAADILLFLITTIIFLGILFYGLHLLLANLRMAKRQRNRKAANLSLGAPLVLLFMTFFFNLSPASRTEVFLLIALAVGMTYVETEVNRQLRSREGRRRRH